ncbi:hypothetical protein cyc_01104 [Cyclospora cayetanensis]|uniref:Uncharacterized protein n=1 Tax=Cyclospora cayetanensis TaxID=88456 RepID=A0A1D3CYI8_9EIME|nr:hypothetical protein cyc_01104 [Cyclospora cayetanensis]
MHLCIVQLATTRDCLPVRWKAGMESGLLRSSRLDEEALKEATRAHKSLAGRARGKHALRRLRGVVCLHSQDGDWTALFADMSFSSSKEPSVRSNLGTALSGAATNTRGGNSRGDKRAASRGGERAREQGCMHEKERGGRSLRHSDFALHAGMSNAQPLHTSSGGLRIQAATASVFVAMHAEVAVTDDECAECGSMKLDVVFSKTSPLKVLLPTTNSALAFVESANAEKEAGGCACS